MDAAHKLATYDDLLALPEDVRAEVIDGVVVLPPSPLPRHNRVQSALTRHLGGPFDEDDGRGGPGGWWILLDIDVRLTAHRIVRPDAVGWKREHLPEPWDVRPIDVRPDWICEVVSPSNVAMDRVKKRRMYADAGIPFFWIIDSREGTLEALRLQGDTWVDAGSHDRTAVARIPPFEAVELEVGRLFPPGEAG
jgi:Uma2 family endonuclease